MHKFGLNYIGKVYDLDEMKSYIERGYGVIPYVEVEGGHWVLAIGHNSSGFIVMDPYYDTTFYEN